MGAAKIQLAGLLGGWAGKGVTGGWGERHSHMHSEEAPWGNSAQVVLLVAPVPIFQRCVLSSLIPNFGLLTQRLASGSLLQGLAEGVKAGNAVLLHRPPNSTDSALAFVWILSAPSSRALPSKQQHRKVCLRTPETQDSSAGHSRRRKPSERAGCPQITLTRLEQFSFSSSEGPGFDLFPAQNNNLSTS